MGLIPPLCVLSPAPRPPGPLFWLVPRVKVAIYARVSTQSQDPAPQLARLRAWAAQNEHEVALERSEVASGRLARRPAQDEIMGEALGRRVGAVAVVKVDRWARSLKHLAATVEALHARGASFHAVDQGLTVAPREATSGLILSVLGAVAEWEGQIISERTRDGLVGRVGRGRHWKDCGGQAHPCPTGVHKSNGMGIALEGNA